MLIEFIIVVLTVALLFQSVVIYFIIKLLVNKERHDKSSPPFAPGKIELDQKIEIPEIIPSIKKPPRPSGGFGSNVG